MIETLTGFLWVAGSAFALLAAVGVLRMPDVFTRMQASTKASTLGLGCLLGGAALELRDVASVIRLVSIGAFLLLTTPVAAPAPFAGFVAEETRRWGRIVAATGFRIDD